MAENPMLSFLQMGDESHDANLPMPSTPANLILADLDAGPLLFLCGNVWQV
jgi:hypothetical protein